MTIHAIHGFLGLPTDWKQFPLFKPVNLWGNEILPYWQWADCFNHQGPKGHSEEPSFVVDLVDPVDPESRSIDRRLLGYSLGGRLALHALIDDPERWDSAVIISAHPGLSDGMQQQRVLDDERWAKRFETAPWEPLMAEWNGNAVFAGDTPVVRHECDYDRQKLAQALRIWSLGRQENLLEKIKKLPMPILWIVGEKDLKFVEISKAVQFSNPKSRIVVVANSGHRVPWQQPMQFKTHIEEWNHDSNTHQTMDTHRTL